MPPRLNQHKPLPPIDEIAPHIARYWKMRKTDKEAVRLLNEEHIDTAIYGIGLTSYRSIRLKLGYVATRQQDHTVESIHEPMQELRNKYPLAGAREMTSLLFHEKELSVSRHLVSKYFVAHEPKLITERKAGRLKRRRFWAAGINDIIAVDQHDKWKRFGLALHNGLDPFIGKLHWMKIWWTNSNPKLILSYYLEVVQRSKSIPLVTQSDPGSENYGIANAQTALRHWYDPGLVGTIQHRWMRQKKNVKPEIAWSQLRRRWTPGFENLLEFGVTNGWYQIHRPLDMLVFRYLFIPFLQDELDIYVDRVNNTKKRADRNKIIPHGIPNDIEMFPEKYRCFDFKITVKQDAIDHVRQAFAPPDDPVFELVPSAFKKYADELYESMGKPKMTMDSAWDIYRELLHRFEHLEDAIEFIEECEIYIQNMEDLQNEEEAVLPAGADLLGGMENREKDGTYYMGGVNNGKDDNQLRQLDEMNSVDNETELVEVEFTDYEGSDQEYEAEDDDHW